MLRVILVVAVSALLASCNARTPTAPGPTVVDERPPSSTQTVLILLCENVGQDVACRAFAVNTLQSGSSQLEVTATVQWTATPADVVQMVAPGRFRPVREGEVAIEARSSAEVQTLLPSRFLVAPGADARQLASLLVLVRGTDGAVEEAIVEVLDGHAAGATCTTVLGGCIVDSVLPTETFNVRASKSGYQPATVTHRGLPRAFGPAVFMTITLTRE